jgi:hypothetical protein
MNVPLDNRADEDKTLACGFPASRSNPQVGGAGRGGYVEVNGPAGMQPVNLPGEGPWGFVPTGGGTLKIGDLNPKYAGLGLFGLW